LALGFFDSNKEGTAIILNKIKTKYPVYRGLAII